VGINPAEKEVANEDTTHQSSPSLAPDDLFLLRGVIIEFTYAIGSKTGKPEGGIAFRAQTRRFIMANQTSGGYYEMPLE
jgi:hypothetical protein